MIAKPDPMNTDCQLTLQLTICMLIIKQFFTTSFEIVILELSIWKDKYLSRHDTANSCYSQEKDCWSVGYWCGSGLWRA